MEKLNKKHKDNFDDNKMEEYKFDPNDYCRLCDGHLEESGTWWIVEEKEKGTCQSEWYLKREKTSLRTNYLGSH